MDDNKSEYEIYNTVKNHIETIKQTDIKFYNDDDSFIVSTNDEKDKITQLVKDKFNPATKRYKVMRNNTAYQSRRYNNGDEIQTNEVIDNK